MFFDFVDGAAGDEKLCELNSTALDQIRLEPKVLRNVEKRNLSKNFLTLTMIFLLDLLLWVCVI